MENNSLMARKGYISCEQFIPRDLLAMRNAFLFLFVPLPFLFFLEIKKGIALWCLSPRQTTCAFRVYSRRSCLPDRESYKFSWSSRVTSTSNDERWILHLDHLPRHRYETNEKTACRVTESDSREINVDGKGKFGFLIYFCRFLEREEFLYFLD